MATHMTGTREEWLAGATLGTADLVCLAAAPTFGLMALLTSALGAGAQDMVCPAMQSALPLSGMAWMYMLMAAFHSTPWLKLIANRWGGVRRS